MSFPALEKCFFFQQGNPPARSTEVTIHERSFQIQHAKVPKNHQVSLVASLWASCASFPTMVLVGKKKARNLKRQLTHHGSQQNSTSPLFQEEAEVFKKIERYQCLQSLRFASKFFCEEIQIWSHMVWSRWVPFHVRIRISTCWVRWQFDLSSPAT